MHRAQPGWRPVTALPTDRWSFKLTSIARPTARADTYYVRAFVVSPDYQLVVTRDADFDAGGNDSLIRLRTSRRSTRSWATSAIATKTGISSPPSPATRCPSPRLPGNGPLEFVNPLSAGLATRPQLELYDPTGGAW